MKIKILGGVLVGILAITSIANAQTKTPIINHREHNQERRINQGVRSGDLTKSETRHLRADENKVRNDKRMAKADGHVTHAERKHLRKEENRTSRTIYRKKHNDRVRA